MKNQAVIAIVEDDDALREVLCDTAQLAGYEVLPFRDGSDCLRGLRSASVDLVISDLQMAPMDGLTLLRELRRAHRDLPFVLMTAHGTIQSAIDAMRLGATDYLVKPFEAEVLIAGLDQWLPKRLEAQGERDMIAEDPATRRVLELARRVAASDATVFITGESGVGKEVFFRFIHQHSSRAAKEPVAINCAAIPENMLEAILFGHEKGAFTGAHKAYPGKFEQAQGSSLLLDEVSEMSLPLQAKLLRVLQERVVERLGSQELIKLDVRVVATSNRDLAADPRMAGGQIRRFLILHKALEADDGELTRTNKVRRGFIGERYKPLVDALYDGSKSIYIKVDVTFEDGRKGTIEGDIAVRDVAPHAALKKAS